MRLKGNHTPPPPLLLPTIFLATSLGGLWASPCSADEGGDEALIGPPCTMDSRCRDGISGWR
jgi:hypothetical protein